MISSLVKTYTIDDCLGIESLYLCVCIQLIEVAYSECQIGIGEELDCLCFLHSHEEGIDVFLDGTFLEQSGEGLSCFLQHLDIGYRLDCLVLLCKLWAFYNLWIAYDDAAWVKVIIECLALTKELRREEEKKVLVKRHGISESDARNIVTVAATVRSKHAATELSSSLSTRETLMAARLISDGWSAQKAMELTFLPLFEGTKVEGERAVVMQIILSR